MKKIAIMLTVATLWLIAAAAYAKPERLCYRGEDGNFVWYTFDEEQWKKDIGYYKENDGTSDKELPPEDK